MLHGGRDTLSLSDWSKIPHQDEREQRQNIMKVSKTSTQVLSEYMKGGRGDGRGAHIKRVEEVHHSDAD